MRDAGTLVPPAAAGEVAAAWTDADLLNQAGAGGTEAREELARRYRGQAYVLALQLLGNPDDALDVAQDAMLRFFAGLDRIAPGRAIRPWLLAIVRNEVRDVWRRRRVRRAESIDGAADGLAAQLVDAGPDPEQSARLLELRRQVWRAMSSLSVDHREIIVLRDFHGLSYDEIARVLKIKGGTVMSRLHAARQKLRAHLAEETDRV